MDNQPPLQQGLEQWASDPTNQSFFNNQQNQGNDTMSQLLSLLGMQQGTPAGESTQPAASSVPTSQLQQYAQQQAQAAFPNDPNAWNSLNSIINQESGWNPQAANKTSSARGLGQFLTSTSQEYGLGPDASQADPQAQIQAVIKYIANRYGTPSQALVFHQKNNWY